MADQNALAGLYPQPPQQQGNALADPVRMIGAMNALTQGQIMQREMASRQAVGAAYQGAVDPTTGLVDTQAAGRAIAGNPAAAYGAPEAYGSLASLHGQQISNDTASFKLAVGQNSTLQDAVGAMANDPNLTADKVRSTITGLARRTNVPSSMFNSVLDSMPQNGSTRALHNWAANFGSISMGSATASDRVDGAPDPNTGAPTNISRGAANYAGAYPAALPPGQGEAFAAGQGAYLADQQKAASTMAALRPLEQALPLIEQLNHYNFGPGSPELAKIKAGLSTFGVIDPNTSDATVRQEVSKYLNNYTNQSRGAGRSDEGLAQAKASTPSLDLTQPANLALIKNQVAMDRMDAAAPTAFQMERGTGMDARAKYPDYKGSYYPKMDTRAFRFDLMSPQERSDLLTSLGVKFDAQGRPIMPDKPGPALQKFQQSYAVARRAANYGANANGQ